MKSLLIGTLVLMAWFASAQEDRLIRAEQLYHVKKIDPALLAIDSAVINIQTKNDFTAWTLRAYVYYEKYKLSQRSVLNSPLRDTIVKSIIKSNSLQPDSAYLMQNGRLLLSLAAHYNNISKSLLEDSVNNVRSNIAYNKYKELTNIASPGTDFKTKDIQYYLAVGSQYAAYFIKDNNDSKSQEIAKVALFKVLELQPDNQLANLDLGLMHFNQAVNLSKSLDFGADFSQIDIVQDNMVKLAKQAEQYIIQVYQKDNKNAKALEALFYVYRMLNETQKSEDFKKKAEAQGVKFVDETTDTGSQK